ncbi:MULTISPECIES: hypothetical protein [unclassified Kribbella]|uniref:hypothetical protein n=1 Tax=unclassified Kribbella TaxID=2644121 RepID=UPI0030193A10
MSATVFPVGFYGGARDAEQVVRVGWSQHRLGEDAFGVWVLAHGLPEVGKGAWTPEDVIQQAESVGIPDAGKELEALADAGSVVVVDDPANFARSHRMDVLFVGLGNAPDRVDGHAVGIPGVGTAAVLDPDCYELWQWGSVAPTLWHSCELRATVTADHGQPANPVTALAEILGDLRFLIAHGCAYLDVAG